MFSAGGAGGGGAKAAGGGDLQRRRADTPTDPAMPCLAFGEADRMFDYLELAYEQKDPGLPWMLSDPIMKPFRSDPRPQKLKTAAGLPP